jgi:hypothetical protein
MRTLLISVDEHDALPDGCQMRFSALGPRRPLSRVRLELPGGEEGVCLVEGRDENDRVIEAWVAPVDDSSAGQAWLVGGGAHGLRIRPEAGGESWAEAYLLLSEDPLAG